MCVQMHTHTHAHACICVHSLYICMYLNNALVHYVTLHTSVPSQSEEESKKQRGKTLLSWSSSIIDLWFNWKLSKSAKTFSGLIFFPCLVKKQRLLVCPMSFNNFNFTRRLWMEALSPLDRTLGIKETKPFLVCSPWNFFQILSCRWHSLYLTSEHFCKA